VGWADLQKFERNNKDEKILLPWVFSIEHECDLLVKRQNMATLLSSDLSMLSPAESWGNPIISIPGLILWF
jgi:hypothetical protein